MAKTPRMAKKNLFCHAQVRFLSNRNCLATQTVFMQNRQVATSQANMDLHAFDADNSEQDFVQYWSCQAALGWSV